MSRNQRTLVFTSGCPTIFWVKLFPEDLNTGWSFHELYELRLHDINVRIWKQLLQICHKSGLSVYTPLVSQWNVKSDSGLNDRYCIGLYSRCYMFLFSLNFISKGSFKVGLKCLPWRWRWYVPMKDHCICTRLHVITSYKRVFFIGTIVGPSDLKSSCLNLIFVTEYIFV